MSRHLAFALFVTLIALLAILSLREHEQSLPVVHAAAPVQAPRLFTPCPLGPRNIPIPEERKA